MFYRNCQAAVLLTVHGSGTDAFSRRKTNIFHGRNMTPRRRLSVKMGLSPSLARERLPVLGVMPRRCLSCAGLSSLGSVKATLQRLFFFAKSETFRKLVWLDARDLNRLCVDTSAASTEKVVWCFSVAEDPFLMPVGTGKPGRRCSSQEEVYRPVRIFGPEWISACSRVCR